MAADGSIRRLSKGYYDVPRTNPQIGVLSPTPQAIIAAHIKKTGATIERPDSTLPTGSGSPLRSSLGPYTEPISFRVS